MNEKLLRRRLSDAIRQTERDQEEAERKRLPASRDKARGMRIAYERVKEWLDESEGKE